MNKDIVIDRNKAKPTDRYLEEEQKEIFFKEACLGAIKLSEENSKQLHKHNQPKQLITGITIPYFIDRR